ncbi:WXG100-like domain-containing protein [Micromonospora chersina]|uniref:WXG100-like domain-containing protein n=1 Tax=Micromonospora chersina TaxID=47854 RepID=UPI00368E087E
MGLELPGELRSLLGILGYTWPEADEVKLFEMGNAWIRFSGTLSGVVAEAHTGAATVWSSHTGQDITAFESWWNREDSPADSLRDGVTAAVLTGTGLIICGAIVLALKIAVIVQLVVLAIQIAQAIATAAVTFGASLLEIPIFQQLARTIVGNLVQEVIWKLIDG